jgi:hypothetical protein
MQTLYPLFVPVAFVMLVAAAVTAGRIDKPDWRVVATICALLLAFTLFTIAKEGPVGFWANHSRNAWGNQVWFDLLIGIGVAWASLQGRLRAASMHRWRWLALILLTGCIGLTAMYARLLYLEAKERVRG